MAKLLLLLFSLLSLSLVRLGTPASISPEAYWKLKLPNTPMPETIEELLAPPGDEPISRPSAKESLTSIKDDDGLLSHRKPSLRSLNGYAALLSYNNKESFASSHPRNLESTNGYDGSSSYNKKGLESTNGGYGALLSYNKKGLESTNGGYGALLSYSKKGLESTNGGYGALLSYSKKGLESTNGGYGALLSYSKKGLESTNGGYGALLSYSKKGLESTNGGYGALLSYSKKGLESTNGGYGALLSYSKKGLESTNGGYGALLSYSKKGLESTNGGYGALLSYSEKGLESTNSGYDALLSYVKQPDDHAKESNLETQDQVFFVEESLQVGGRMALKFQKGAKEGFFLPREISNQIPFSSDKIQETLRILSLDPKSKEAFVLSKRIELCEEPTVEGVEKKCVTSLESMVDYVISKIGTNVKALTTQVEKDHSMMEYTIKGVKDLAKDDHETVVCHKMGYPYAVFFCHRTKTIRSYMVSLVGKDGTKIEAVAACHKETNEFLDNYAKNVLKVVPGSTRICHFPAAKETIIWVSK
ncbi:BURP domain-containing protein 3 [Beta vulgaris subsp. vulgaris]|uniref:BURP domain-containing protein 3 n=1 Tax=Beta vulgaris subsp. vulgaris TaxID=3555 RepID=UPI002036EB1B|nr:BURP domain-containing protein 3 [Beta vulgaris subsp. vulgaris]